MQLSLQGTDLCSSGQEGMLLRYLASPPRPQDARMQGAFYGALDTPPQDYTELPPSIIRLDLQPLTGP